MSSVPATSSTASRMLDSNPRALAPPFPWPPAHAAKPRRVAYMSDKPRYSRKAR